MTWSMNKIKDTRKIQGPNRKKVSHFWTLHHVISVSLILLIQKCLRNVSRSTASLTEAIGGFCINNSNLWWSEKHLFGFLSFDSWGSPRPLINTVGWRTFPSLLLHENDLFAKIEFHFFQNRMGFHFNSSRCHDYDFQLNFSPPEEIRPVEREIKKLSEALSQCFVMRRCLVSAAISAQKKCENFSMDRPKLSFNNSNVTLGVNLIGISISDFDLKTFTARS